MVGYCCITSSESEEQSLMILSCFGPLTQAKIEKYSINLKVMMKSTAGAASLMIDMQRSLRLSVILAGPLSVGIQAF